VMLSNCRVMPVQFRLTSAMSNSITPGVATDHQSPKRGETQVRQNPLRPSLLAQSSMSKQLNPRNCRKLASGHHGKQGATAKEGTGYRARLCTSDLVGVSQKPGR